MATEPTGLVEHLRVAWEAGRPVPPFALFGRGTPPEAIHDALKKMADEDAARPPGQPTL